MNEIVGDAIDVGVNHQGINEAHDQHDPERRIRKKEIHRQEVEEVKQAGQRGHDVPSRVRKNLRISFGAFDMDGFSHVHPTSQVCATRLQKQLCAVTRRAALNESGTIRTRSLIRTESIHPAGREEHLPTLSLEKLVPAGIAEVSPWRFRVGEGKDVSRWPGNSRPRAERKRLAIWVTTE